MLYNKNLFREYPDSMSLTDVAHALGVSTKTASNMIRRGDLFAVKAGREYRVAKTTLMEYLGDRPSMYGAAHRNNCVVSVTSNRSDWTSAKKCDMLCADPEQPGSEKKGA